MSSRSLKGRSIVVTGGASGIGLAAGRLALASGASVVLLDRDQATLELAADGLRRDGDVALLAVPCDVTDEASLLAAFDRLPDHFPPCTGIVAAAGIDIGGPLHEMDRRDWDRVIEVNLTGTFLTLKHGLRRLLAGEAGGSVVCLSSPAARMGLAAGGAGAYSASKAGVSALVRVAAVDYAAHGIRVNALLPGPTETPLMWANVASARRSRVRATVIEEVPLGRIADPDEPAAAALWLLSDEARYVTGTELVCDGGVLAKGSISV